MENLTESPNLDVVLDVKVQATVQLGSCELPMKEIFELNPGSVFSSNSRPKIPSDFFIKPKLIAYGEVVVVEDNFGIKLTELVGELK